MKKGLSYVDISVSIAIFLIYLIIAFILFKPSIKEENISLLLPHLRNSFESSVSWKIDRYPVFLKTNNTESFDYEIEIPFNFSYDNINIVYENFTEKPFHYKKTDKTFNITFEDTLEPNKKRPYYILYSKDINFT